jgi:hypothetical protein
MPGADCRRECARGGLERWAGRQRETKLARPILRSTVNGGDDASGQNSEPFSPYAKLPITLCLPNLLDGGTTNETNDARTTGGSVHAEGIW